VRFATKDEGFEKDNLSNKRGDLMLFRAISQRFQHRKDLTLVKGKSNDIVENVASTIIVRIEVNDMSLPGSARRPIRCANHSKNIPISFFLAFSK